ncbi:MAG: hypothetical protein WC291_03705, partial [Thermodesulfovibrionales bacterium]
MVSVIEGVVPRTTRTETFLMMTKGLVSDPTLASHFASDVAGIMGGAPHRKGGAWTFFPRWKIPEKVAGIGTPKFLAGKELFYWAGRSWIDLSNAIGNSLRQNFVMQRMSRHLAERAYQEAGGDFMLALERLIGDVPDVGRKTLGLSKDDLKNEIFRRLTVSSDDVKGLAGHLTDGNLQKAEALKILRGCDNLSPRARTLGEQLIEEGKVLNTEKSIKAFAEKVAETSIEDLKRLPMDIGESFRGLADDVVKVDVNNQSELMEVFTTYETMSSTASYIPHRMMSQTMDEADILYESGQFRKLEQLWRSRREEMLLAMEDVSGSMTRVRTKLLENRKFIKDKKARAALDSVLTRADETDLIRQATLEADAGLLDTFWATSRAERTPEAFTALRAQRAELWSKYQTDVAVSGAAEYLARRDLSELYHNLPAAKLKPVDARHRGLTTQDLANVFGVNVDGLCTGMLDNLSLHGKDYFVQLVKQSADKYPDLFQGFTELKIAKVYDNILTQARMRPDVDIAVQKMAQQADNMRQELISLRMRHALGADEEKALKTWIDKIAKGRDKLIGKKGKITQERWTTMRQESLNEALKDYYKAFA